VSFVLVEKDWGGLGAYLNSPSTLPDRELAGEITSGCCSASPRRLQASPWR